MATTHKPRVKQTVSWGVVHSTREYFTAAQLRKAAANRTVAIVAAHNSKHKALEAPTH